MTVHIYRSTDTGAPTLNGTAGSLISVLDACLVNGYGTQAPAGWTKPYSGTNIAYYQQPTSANNLFWYINDTAGTNATMYGYETVTSVSTTSGQFPSSSVVPYITKTTSSGITSGWTIYTNEKIVYLITNGQNSNQYISTGVFAHAFGDITSFCTTPDRYNTVIVGNYYATGASCGIVECSTYVGIPQPSPSYIARAYHQTGKYCNLIKISSSAMLTTSSGQTVMGNASYGQSTFPNLADNNLYVSPILAWDTYTLRGQFPGLLVTPYFYTNFNDGDIITNIAGHTGNTYEYRRLYGSADTYRGGMLVETSNTW